MQATLIRTKMIGGGNSYSVYWLKSQKDYEPISNFCYATTVINRGKHYYTTDDMLRTPTIDQLPIVTSERLTAFNQLRKQAKNIDAFLLKKFFPETNGKDWTNTNLCDKTKVVKFDLELFITE